MYFRTIYDLNHAVQYNLYRLPKDIDLIVGIPRSGMLVASMISLYLNLPLTDLDSFLRGYIMPSGVTKTKDTHVTSVDKVRKILLVDDSASSGRASREALLKLLPSKVEICFLICYVTSKTKEIPDIYFEQLDSPRMFEWNYLHHVHLGYLCFDLDGVLCLNPKKEEDDDGEKYLHFLNNATLRVTPTRQIGHIVTCRLEKYRYETEKWLDEKGIRYKELIMMNYQTALEKKLSKSNGVFKGEIYKNIRDSFLFVESDAFQASEIAKVSQKLVFCTSNHKVYGNEY